MYNSILVPLDGSAFAERELLHAVKLCRPAGVLHLMRVTQLALSTPAVTPSLAALHLPSLIGEERQRCQDYLNSLSQLVGGQEPGLRVVTHIENGSPERVIAEVARQEQVDLVVMSAHHRSWLERLFHGSTTEGVLDRLEVPVLVLKSEEENPSLPEVRAEIVRALE